MSLQDTPAAAPRQSGAFDGELTPNQAGRKLGIDRCTVRRWFRCGILVGIQRGRRLYLTRDSVNAVLNAPSGSELNGRLERCRVQRDKVAILSHDDPTPDQIAACCADIRAGWTAEQRDERSATTPHWRPPALSRGTRHNRRTVRARRVG